jgi:hypothetical protein
MQSCDVQRFFLLGLKFQARKHFYDALPHMRSKNKEGNVGIRALCRAFLEYQKITRMLRGVYDAVTVCTKGPPTPEIDEFPLASKTRLDSGSDSGLA